ncbi:MAG TPA: Asp-tRNA(Asn)/Glu-tRNA(Gln) amidotransferase subunit GatA [Chloroflexota bacterium]|nr:Asp-tRNA(Asn)/Glu-tRNA(Gln) amidotransferase subunit GatA [Chloroflexota bacterium]
MNLAELTAHDAADRLARREISALELTDAVLEQIDRRESTIRAYLTLLPERAREQAREIDRRRLAGESLPPLAGIPTAVKDNISTQGIRTTCASRMLERYVPQYNATVVERLRAAGTVVLGKTNMDEFAMGSSTEFSSFSPTVNPWDPSLVPGGSSGGSAAAVAANEATIALGSDTGGSIRLPASFCGLVGLKPTYGRVSRYGLVAFGSSLDQIGPLTRDVTDAALVLSAISGHDSSDSTSLAWPVPDYRRALIPDVKGLRIGVPSEYFVEGMDPAVAEAVRQGINQLSALGATVEETSLPNTKYALAAYYVVAPAEASSNLARYDGVKYTIRVDGNDVMEMMDKTREAGFGPEVKRRIIVGTYTLSAGYYDAYYVRAQKVRTLIKRDFDQAFQKFDVLAVPTAPTVAFPLGARIEDPVAMYLTDVCTVTVNAAGLPGLVVPCALVRGLPVGLQLLGAAGSEETLLRTGFAFEQSGDWRTRKFGE